MLKSGQVDFYIDLSLLKSNNYLSNSYVVSGSVCFLVTQEVCVVVSVFQDMSVWSLKITFLHHLFLKWDLIRSIHV